MGNAIFVVWRECLEGVLIVSILYAFLVRQRSQALSVGDFAAVTAAQRGLRYLAVGIAGGIALSGILGFVLLKVQEGLAGQALEYFQASILIISALLMTQMVFWMNKHGRQMKKTLETELSTALESDSSWGVAVVAMLAIAREGAETVVYLYGMTYEGSESAATTVLFASIAGIALALGTAWIVSRGVRFLHYGMVFKVTGILLLITASSLVVAATSKLIELEALPTLVDPLWNTSAFLDSGSSVGGFISSFTGYRSRPSGMVALAYGLYWVITVGLLKRRSWAPVRPAAVAGTV